jgi:hypothetical protein
MQYRKVTSATENCLAICGSFRFIHTNRYFMQRKTNDASAINGQTSRGMQHFQTTNSDVCTTHWNIPRLIYSQCTPIQWVPGSFQRNKRPERKLNPHLHLMQSLTLNLLMSYISRTAPLTSKRFILYI